MRLSMKVTTAKVAKNLRDIQTKDIPAAKHRAFTTGAKTGISRASKQLAANLNVPAWMIRGQKGKGSRFSKSRYDTKKDRGFITFRTRHINPAGTKRKQRPIRVYKNGSVGVPGHKFDNAFGKNFRHFDSIYKKKAGGGLDIAKIEITQAHISAVKRTLRRVIPREFAKKFEKELAYKLRKRGAR